MIFRVQFAKDGKEAAFNVISKTVQEAFMLDVPSNVESLSSGIL